jgi:tRNA 5-methylaminomethyl-2-thiouridine biosynthesis bifunctional protein
VTGSETSPLVWDADGAPRSRRFDDIYFSKQDGLAESRAVFLHGCGLPQAWGGRRRFTVGELGFGTGLNIAALLDLWRREGAAGARLSIFSIEAYPMTADEARRALAGWPEIAEASHALISAWPGRAPGFHRVDLPAWNATLDVAVMEAEDALAQWRGRADAWFLDGFSPSANPQMWRQEVLALVAARSAPGARAATFTVAGAVRRGLEAEGFSVAKRPGHGRKRERLEAVLPGEGADPGQSPRVAIVGAGIAGAALARAFTSLGVRPVVIEATAPGAGASGNPAALVSPRFDAGGGPVAQLYAQAFARAVRLYRSEAAGAVIATGALQLDSGDRDGRRFDVVASSDLYETGAIERLPPQQASGRLGESSAVGGLWIADALTIEPAAAIRPWLAGADRLQAAAASLARMGTGWSLRDSTGGQIGEFDVVVFAAGAANARLTGLPLRPVRGQVSIAATRERPAPAAWGGYVLPTRDGLLFGATHDRDDADDTVRDADAARNRTLLAKARPALAAALAATALDGRAAVRAAGPNHLPLAGALGEAGLFVLGGLGGRGFTLAPLLGEHVAALALGVASPLPATLARIVDPAAFRERATGAGSGG